MSIQEIQERRARMREEAERARAEQEAIDLLALADAEEQHGFGRVESLPVKHHVKGCPTFAIVKVPEALFYKRFNSAVASAKGKASAILEAQEQIGQSCLIYPPKGEVRDAMEEAFPGLLVSCGQRAVKLAELDSAEEKKG